MKRYTLTLIFAAAAVIATAAPAADSVMIHSPRVPILLERIDNELFEVRIEARSGETFDSLTVEFSEDADMADIESLRLYYGGGEGQRRKGLHYKPAAYIPRDTPVKTLEAHPSYSVLQSEAVKPARKVVLTSGQPMLEGVNYFWVSIRMSPKASLSTLLSARITDITVGGRSRTMGHDDTGVRRLGTGVRHAGDDGAAAYRIPGLVTANDGTLIAVYDIRRNSSTDLQGCIDIGVSRSTDKGETWSDMTVAMTFAGEGGLPDAQNGVGDPAILVDEQTGTIWIAAVHAHGMGSEFTFHNSMPGLSPEQTGQLMLVRSDDNGLTWSEPINITSQVKRPEWCFLLQGPGRGITMHDGTLVFPIQFLDPDRLPHAGIMYSRDQGETWHIHNPARSDTTEAQAAEISDGVLMLNMRDNRGGSRAVSTTCDMGRTWVEHPSNRKALREPVCMASLINIKAEDNVLGRDILVFSNPDTEKRRHNITIKASLDGGLTWLPENQILLDEEDGWGYSCLTLVDPETIGILYEASTAHMTFQTIKIKQLVTDLR